MNKKGGNVIRIVLGVYLIYLGVSIFIEVVQKNPANSGFMGAAGGIFAEPHAAGCRHYTDR